MKESAFIKTLKSRVRLRNNIKIKRNLGGMGKQISIPSLRQDSLQTNNTLASETINQQVSIQENVYQDEHLKIDDYTQHQRQLALPSSRGTVQSQSYYINNTSYLNSFRGEHISFEEQDDAEVLPFRANIIQRNREQQSLDSITPDSGCGKVDLAQLNACLVTLTKQEQHFQPLKPKLMIMENKSTPSIIKKTSQYYQSFVQGSPSKDEEEKRLSEYQKFLLKIKCRQSGAYLPPSQSRRNITTVTKEESPITVMRINPPGHQAEQKLKTNMQSRSASKLLNGSHRPWQQRIKLANALTGFKVQQADTVRSQLSEWQLAYEHRGPESSNGPRIETSRYGNQQNRESKNLTKSIKIMVGQTIQNNHSSRASRVGTSKTHQMDQSKINSPQSFAQPIISQIRLHKSANRKFRLIM